MERKQHEIGPSTRGVKTRHRADTSFVASLTKICVASLTNTLGLQDDAAARGHEQACAALG